MSGSELLSKSGITNSLIHLWKELSRTISRDQEEILKAKKKPKTLVPNFSLVSIMC